MANIAHNTYLFYGDKDELVKCHTMLNNIYEKVGSDKSCVVPEFLRINPEWIDHLDEILEGLDDRFYMETDSKRYGNPLYWYNWVNSNFTNLSVAFRCEEPLLGIFEQIDPDNVFSDVVWLQGRYIPKKDVQKLPYDLRECCYREDGGLANSFYILDAFNRDAVFNNDFKLADLPDTIKVREYTNTTYDALISEPKRIRSLEEKYRTAHENGILFELF